MPQKSMNVVALVKKNQERFIFVYDDQSVSTLLNQLQKFVDDDELDFTDADAEILLDRIFSDESRIEQPFE